MDEATRQDKPKSADAIAADDDQILIEETTEPLLRAFGNLALGREHLDVGVRTGKVRLLCGGKIVPIGFIVTDVRVGISRDDRFEISPSKEGISWKKWSVFRKEINALIKSASNPRGAGRHEKFIHADIVTEAAIYVVKNKGLPFKPGKDPTLDDLVVALQTKLGRKKMAGDTRGKEILRTFFNRVKEGLR